MDASEGIRRNIQLMVIGQLRSAPEGVHDELSGKYGRINDNEIRLEGEDGETYIFGCVVNKEKTDPCLTALEELGHTRFDPTGYDDYECGRYLQEVRDIVNRALKEARGEEPDDVPKDVVSVHCQSTLMHEDVRYQCSKQTGHDESHSCGARPQAILWDDEDAE